MVSANLKGVTRILGSFKPAKMTADFNLNSSKRDG